MSYGKIIYQRYTNVLLTKVYKYLNYFSPELMNEIFYLTQNHYNLRNLNVIATNIPRNKFMLNSTVYRVNQLWQTLPSTIANTTPAHPPPHPTPHPASIVGYF